MMVVEDLRKPLVIEDAIDVLGLRLRRCEEVAVVVVPDVLLIKARQVRQGPFRRVAVAHVPIGDQVVTVRVRVHEQDDRVVEKAHRLLVGTADHLVDHLRELLRAQRFGRVQPAVDPDDCLAFLRERSRLLVVQAFGQRKTAGDLLVMREPLVVLR